MAEDKSNLTSVYRYYDSAGVLLYVGITNRGSARNEEHDRSKDWWPYVTRQEVSHYRSRAAAANVERETIRQYRPPFNVQHNVDHVAVREAYLAFRAKHVDISALNLAARSKDSHLRFSMAVITCHGDVVTLTSLPQDAAKIAKLDLSVASFDLGSGGRGARFIAVGIEDGALRIMIRMKGAKDCGGADVLLRQASRRGGPTGPKRIDLHLPSRSGRAGAASW